MTADETNENAAEQDDGAEFWGRMRTTTVRDNRAGPFQTEIKNRTLEACGYEEA